MYHLDGCPPRVFILHDLGGILCSAVVDLDLLNPSLAVGSKTTHNQAKVEAEYLDCTYLAIWHTSSCAHQDIQVGLSTSPGIHSEENAHRLPH
ncbi:hypothetical protein Pst134EA_028228 [Puccinia striiformis f. sp. tritici]|uniref:hypothetical protein n=1 Tax=Puccinia striiformis f. sp. tritici TaxID=168172 RepID=UPI00200769BC|nr:hypothetical protein Pst134EA_028228 [Puccinia striiformis f. sp. tritici]KAH9448939.1 hypothetical protein Pst134EA_028228 [Puccinia striiformis f. sp. tritici]